MKLHLDLAEELEPAVLIEREDLLTPMGTSTRADGELVLAARVHVLSLGLAHL